MGNSQQRQNQYQQIQQKNLIIFRETLQEQECQKLCWVSDNGTNKFNKNDSLLSYLKSKPTQKIKLITVIGPQGYGKSTFLNFILKEFQGESFNVFKASQNQEHKTIGVDYKIVEIGDTSYIFFDCQGFDDSKSDKYERRVKTLMSLLCRISTCTFYLSFDIRMSQGFQDLINEHLNIEKYETYENLLSNFVEIYNQRTVGESKNKYFSDLFKDTIFLEQFKENNNCIEYSDQYDQNIKKIVKKIKNSQYNTKHETCLTYMNNQDAQTFYEMLISCFQILEEQDIQKLEFMKVIEMQMQLKGSFQFELKELNKLQEIKMKRSFQLLQEKLKQQKHFTIFLLNRILESRINQLNLQMYYSFEKICQDWNEKFFQGLRNIFTNKSETEINQIIKQYDNMDFLKPPILREYKQKLEKEKSNDLQYKLAKLGGLGLYIIGAGFVIGMDATVLTTAAIVLSFTGV